MPYRHAWLWVLGLFPAVALAFWPSYFGRLGSVSWILHAHGITSALWVALLAVQSWSIHRDARPLHKLSGRTSLALFPLFWVSGLLIVQMMAGGFAAKDGPFHILFGARLTPVDLIGSLIVLYLYWLAVSRRRAVLVHAAAMLAIPFFLVTPIIVRLLQIGGPFAIRGPGEFYKFALGFHLSNALALVVAVAIYTRRPKTAWPFLVAAGGLALQSLAFQTLGRAAGWEALMPAVAAVPTPVLAATGLAVSMAVVAWAWFGAKQGRAAPPRADAAAITA
ncbi:MAG TPA: hypothetical protein VGC56_05985 [Allosphingosinicella sp.]|jgi:hypothetical protein